MSMARVCWGLIRCLAAFSRRFFIMVLAVMALSAAGFGLLSPHAFAERPQLPLCQGKNLFDKLKAEQPDVYQSLMALAADELNGSAVFWKVTSPAGKISYLLGTMHSTDPRVTDLRAEARAALQASKRVLVEVAKLSPVQVAQVMSKRPDLFFSLQGGRLNTMISKEDYQVVLEQGTKAGMKAQMIPLLKPWFASVSFFGLPACEQLRLAGKLLVLDKLIEQWGQEAGAEVIGLETLEEQFSAFNNIPLNDQITLLENGVHTQNIARDLYASTVAVYLSRQIGLIMPLSQHYARDRLKSLAANASFKEILINQRNQTMYERALPFMKEGGAFMAVGALHLVGRQGLVALFRQSGFQVETVF